MNLDTLTFNGLYTAIAVLVSKSMPQHGESACDKVKYRIQSDMYVNISLLCKNTKTCRKKAKGNIL